MILSRLPGGALVSEPGLLAVVAIRIQFDCVFR
jgi:hypothetical protein